MKIMNKNKEILYFSIYIFYFVVYIKHGGVLTMGEIRENLKKNLGYYLTLKGISQKDLSITLGVSQAAVTNWIKGKNSPDIEIVAKLCDALDVSINDLMGWGEKPIIPAYSLTAQEVARAFDKASPKDQMAVRIILGLPADLTKKADAEIADEISPDKKGESSTSTNIKDA